VVYNSHTQMEETGAPANLRQVIVCFVRSSDIMPPLARVVKGFGNEFSQFYKNPKK